MQVSYKAKRIIWHLLRATAIFLWLFVNYNDDHHISFTLTSTLVFIGAYDIVLASFTGIGTNIRRKIAIIALPVVLALILMERTPWDSVPGYLPLCLYLPELVVDLKSKKQKMIILSSALIISLITTFFSLYKLGWMTSCPEASIDGHPVSCRLINVLGSSNAIVVADAYWGLVNVSESRLELVSSHRSIMFGNIAFVDKRSQNGLVVDEQDGKTGWDPKLSYKNDRLSFYFMPDRLFVCSEVKL